MVFPGELGIRAVKNRCIIKKEIESQFRTKRVNRRLCEMCIRSVMRQYYWEKLEMKPRFSLFSDPNFFPFYGRFF